MGTEDLAEAMPRFGDCRPQSDIPGVPVEVRNAEQDVHAFLPITGFIEGESRSQATLFPERLDNYITESKQ